MTTIHTSSVSFGRWLKKLRSQHDLTQEALAELAFCSVQTIRFFETGKRRPALEMAGRLVTVLQVPATERETFIRLARTPLVAELTTTPAADAPPPVAEIRPTPHHLPIPPSEETQGTLDKTSDYQELLNRAAPYIY